MASRAITVSASMPTKISSPRRCSSPKLRASALPEFALVRMRTLPLAVFEGKGCSRDFERRVARAVINHDDLQIGIVRGQRRADRPHNNFLFVVRGDQHRNRGKIVGRVAGCPITPGPEPVEDGKGADEDQAPGHQHVAHKENPGHGVERQRKESESKQVQARDPALVGRDRAASLPPASGPAIHAAERSAILFPARRR